MKINVRRLALMCLVGLGFSAPVLAHAACTGGFPPGGYSILVAGNSLPINQGKGGKYLSGQLYFDGNCGFTGNNISGGVAGAVSKVSVTGSYFAKPDGTFALTMTPSDGSVTQTYIVAYSYLRGKAVGIEMDGSAVATIDLQGQFSVPNSYSNASLNGAYATTCSGLGANKNDLNYFYFNGTGQLAGANPFDRNGTIGNASVTGQYVVRSDGTFLGQLNGSFSIFSFYGVISYGQIQYIYTQPGFGGIVACTGTP